MDVINWTTEHWDDIMLVALAACGIAAQIAAWTPSPKDDSILAKVRAVLDIFAGNYGNAKNAKKEPTDKPVEK